MHGHYILATIVFQASFEKLENELKEVNGNAETLKKNFLELTELKHILSKTQHFFDEVGDVAKSHNNPVFCALFVSISINHTCIGKDVSVARVPCLEAPYAILHPAPH